jgi:outer membrane protein
MPALRSCKAFILPLLIGFVGAVPAAAQEEKPPRIVRVAVGAQLVPSYPGAEDHSVRPLFDISFKREGGMFEFEAADESIGLRLARLGGVEFGPAISFEGSRKDKDVGAPVGKVKTTIEAGAFVQAYLAENARVRIEGRRGIGGHDAWVGSVGADYIIRDGDRYVFSIGPRLYLSEARYQQAYFGVSPAAATAAGLPQYRPDGGIHAAGVTSGLVAQLSKSWGVYTYARYDRLLGDAADSPLVRRFGSRNQLSGGLALTYTFGGR